jgi:hypothetical protein
MAVADGGVADPICANEQRTQSHAGNNPRARNVVVVGDVAPGGVVGTLSPGAHPGGFNAAWHISFHYWNRYGFPQC